MRVVGGTGEGVLVERGAGPGAKPRRGPRWGGGGGGGRLSQNVLKMFHEQVLSRNETRFVKIRKQMTTEK